MRKTNLEMIRGDTLSFGLEIEYSHFHGRAVNPQKLETAVLTVKKDYDDDTPVIRKELDKGITYEKTEHDKVYYIVRIAPEDTAGVEEGNYLYDLQIGLNEDIYTVLYGTLTVLNDVTK